MSQARTAAARALHLDDSLAEAHASMGNILHNYDWNWAPAENEYKRAIELNSNRSEEHTSELQSPCNLVCRLLLEKKKKLSIINRIVDRTAEQRFHAIFNRRSRCLQLEPHFAHELALHILETPQSLHAIPANHLSR